MSDDEWRNNETDSEVKMANNSSDASRKFDGVQADWFTRSVQMDEVEEDVPYCALPANFFAFALREKRPAGTSLLTIDSWDGREILSVLRRQ